MSNLFQRVVSKAVLNSWLPEVIEAPDGKRVYIFYGTLTDLIFNHSFAKAFFPNMIVCMVCGKDLFPYEESCCEINGVERSGLSWQYHLKELATMPEEKRYEYLEKFLD
jgi:hypothetical protein